MPVFSDKNVRFLMSQGKYPLDLAKSMILKNTMYYNNISHFKQSLEEKPAIRTKPTLEFLKTTGVLENNKQTSVYI